MSRAAESRVVLAIATTALVMGMIWIFTEISAVSVPSQTPVWRYTRQGWTEVSELAVPAAHSIQGPMDPVSPWVVAALQLLAGLIILIGFASHRQQGESSPPGIGEGSRPRNGDRHAAAESASAE